MPENATDEIKQYAALYSNLITGRKTCLEIEMQLRAKALAMQAAGFVAPDSDPDTFYEKLDQVDQESLR